MLKPSQDIFIRFTEGDATDVSQCPLHKGIILEYTAHLVRITLGEAHLPIWEGADLILYYHDRGQFMQQVCRVVASELGEHLRLELEPQADPISAETREEFRVTTLTAGIKAVIDGDDRCQVRDLSASGFAFISSHEYVIGQSLDVKLERGDERYEGQVTVQSIRRLRQTQVRYGVRCNERGEPSSLTRGLLHLSGEIQREQLRRVRG